MKSIKEIKQELPNDGVGKHFSVSIPQPPKALKNLSDQEYSEFVLFIENIALKKWIYRICCMDEALVAAQAEIDTWRNIGELSDQNIKDLQQLIENYKKDLLSKRSALFKFKK